MRDPAGAKAKPTGAKKVLSDYAAPAGAATERAPAELLDGATGRIDQAADGMVGKTKSPTIDSTRDLAAAMAL